MLNAVCSKLSVSEPVSSHITRTQHCNASTTGMEAQAPVVGEIEDEVVEGQGDAETMPLRAATSPHTPAAPVMEEYRSSGHKQKGIGAGFAEKCRSCESTS